MDARSLWLELTPNCNLSCAFCYNPWRSGGKSRYPEKVAYDVLCDGVGRLLSRMSFSYVALSGGEPLLYPRLLALTEWLSSRRQRTILTTNGRLLTEPKLDALCEAGLSGVQVSLLGSRRRTHDTLAGRSSWLQALHALTLARSRGLSTSATFILTAANVNELPEVTRLVGQLGLSSLVVNELQPVGSAADRLADLSVTHAAYDAAVALATDVGEATGVSIVPIRARTATRTPGPVTPWRRWSVSPGGELKLCNHSTRTLGPLSDLGESALASLAKSLQQGEVGRLRQLVNNCLCMERAAAVA